VDVDVDDDDDDGHESWWWLWCDIIGWDVNKRVRTTSIFLSLYHCIIYMFFINQFHHSFLHSFLPSFRPFFLSSFLPFFSSFLPFFLTSFLYSLFFLSLYRFECLGSNWYTFDPFVYIQTASQSARLLWWLRRCRPHRP
jgi:hypothetical protein